jgi:hypothetical protein
MRSLDDLPRLRSVPDEPFLRSFPAPSAAFTILLADLTCLCFFSLSPFAVRSPDGDPEVRHVRRGHRRHQPRAFARTKGDDFAAFKPFVLPSHQ